MGRFSRTQPVPEIPGKGSGYRRFREPVRSDFQRCCAHCYFHEYHAGGSQGDGSFELDHFWPKDEFPKLKDDFYNLYWSCRICNQRKSNTYPNDFEKGLGMGFVDLCVDEFETHYALLADGMLNPLTPSAKYTIRILGLNTRTPLINKRREVMEMGHRMDVEPPPRQ